MVVFSTAGWSWFSLYMLKATIFRDNMLHWFISYENYKKLFSLCYSTLCTHALTRSLPMDHLSSLSYSMIYEIIKKKFVPAHAVHATYISLVLLAKHSQYFWNVSCDVSTIETVFGCSAVSCSNLPISWQSFLLKMMTF